MEFFDIRMQWSFLIEKRLATESKRCDVKHIQVGHAEPRGVRNADPNVAF